MRCVFVLVYFVLLEFVFLMLFMIFFLCCYVDILDLEHTVCSVDDVVHGKASSIFALISRVNLFSQEL